MKASNLIQNWDLATEDIFQYTGAISTRKTYDDGVDDTLSLVTGDYVELSQEQIDTLEKLKTSFNEKGYCAQADAMTVSSTLVIGAATDNCLQQDLELHRRQDVIGSYADTGEGFLTHVAETAYSGIEIGDLFRRDDPIDVILHALDGEEARRLEYICSVRVDPQAGTAAQTDDGETISLSHVCDIHHGGGWQSITVVRIAETHEGVIKTVIHTDVIPHP